MSYPSTGVGTLVAILTTLFTLATMLLWLWIAWRAMRAHERIADALAQPERNLP